MLTRIRTTWLAGSGALVLVLAISGAALGATVLTAATGPAPDDGTAPLVVDTTATFEDVDGDGIDDDCDTAVVPDADAAAAAQAAVDANADGVVSVSEAAQSGRTGGKNCNHGGYVSGVAHATCDATDEPAPTGTPTADVPVTLVLAEDQDGDDSGADADEAPKANDADEADDAAEPCTVDPEATDATAPVVCVPVPAPTFDPTVFTGNGAFGAYVSTVAKSDAVGGKNCNHGGAVSEAVKAAKEAARAARDAAREAARTEREAAKAEREAARAERATERAAPRTAHQAKVKPHGH